MRPAARAVVAAVAMEPASALLHRLVMHGRGWSWHRSHHQARHGRFERNDLYPLTLATATAGIMGLGENVTSLHGLASVAAGVSAYGLAYLGVHDLYIHQRLGRLPIKSRYLAWVREAHRVHHLFGSAPYGFLCPIVPAELRAKAKACSRDPLVPSTGARPSPEQLSEMRGSPEKAGDQGSSAVGTSLSTHS